MLLRGRGNCTHCSFLKAEHQVSCWKSWDSATHLWVISVESKVFLFCLVRFSYRPVPIRILQSAQHPSESENLCCYEGKRASAAFRKGELVPIYGLFSKGLTSILLKLMEQLALIILGSAPTPNSESTLQHLMMASYMTAVETWSAFLPAPFQSRLACVSLFTKALVD